MLSFWFHPYQWAERRAALRESILWCLVDKARPVANADHTQTADPNRSAQAALQHRLRAISVVAACEEDAATANLAPPLIEAILDLQPSDLGRAAIAQTAVCAFVTCSEFWPVPTQQRIAERLFSYGKQFATIQDGNPDNPFNNWWGVTHSGAGLCFLAALHHFPEALPFLEHECACVASYLQNYGDNGHYYEGTGYGLYSLANWAPFLLAVHHARNLDLSLFTPGIHRIPEILIALSAPFPTINDSTQPTASARQRLGQRVFWNDDGGGFPSPHLASILIALAPPAQRDAIHAAINHFCGPQGDNAYLELDFEHGHPLWTLFFYPLESPRANYGDNLPRSLIDQRTGLTVLRDGYHGPKDTIFACYPKAYHGGGHTQQDAGSFRLISLGRSWIHAGGQAKPQAVFNNVPFPDDHHALRCAPAQSQTGKVAFFGPNCAINPIARGGSLSVDLSDIYAVPRLRRHFAVAFFPIPDFVVLVALLEEIINPNDARRWTFPICHQADLIPEILNDQNLAWQLSDPNANWRMSTWVDSQHTPVDFELFNGPNSHRTFANGTAVEYLGARCILASTTASNLNLLTLFAIHSCKAPPVTFQTDPNGLPSATIGPYIRVHCQHSRWFNGPLRISSSFR